MERQLRDRHVVFLGSLDLPLREETAWIKRISPLSWEIEASWRSSMLAAEIVARFEPIIRDLFDEYDGPVKASLTAEDVEQWDSLANVQLIVMVEKAFGVKFATSEITSLKNLGALADLVAAKSR
jgi:acyl carrier protein